MNDMPATPVWREQSVFSYQVTLVFPQTYNDGRAIDPVHVEWAQQKISRYAGGLTQYAPSEGLGIDQQGALDQEPIQVF